MNHVALCFTDTTGTYYKHALVAALSILDNTQKPLCLHLIHDDTLSGDAAARFTDVCGQYGQKICFYHAQDIPDATVGNVISKLSKGALYRTMLPKLLDVDTVLYFDCDTVCLAEIDDIFELDVTQHYLGAVVMDAEQGRSWASKLRLTCGFCINTGVLLMNLRKIRNDMPDYTEKLFSVVERFPGKIGDQGAVNILFDKTPGAYLFFPEFCNFRTEHEDHSVLPLREYYGKVIHFAGKKPWQVFTLPSLFYWKYYARLFPEEDVFAMMEKLDPYEYAYLFSFILQDDRRRRKVRRWHDFVVKGLWKTLQQKVRRGTKLLVL